MHDLRFSLVVAAAATAVLMIAACGSAAPQPQTTVTVTAQPQPQSTVTVTAKAVAPAAPNASAKKYSDGTYLVGSDMPPGKYKGRSTDPNGIGSWTISSDPNGNNIVADSAPLNAGTQLYLQVRKGQYLQLQGVIVWWVGP